MQGASSFLLASDLDGTLIPHEDDAEHLRQITEFAQLRRAHPAVRLAYVTGRHMELAQEAIDRFNLPVPEDLVCDVGTSVYSRVSGEWALDPAYRNRLRAAWRGMTASEIAGWLTDIPGLRMQEAERQQEFKLSYYVEIQRDQDDFTRQIETRLARHDIRAAVIYSTDPAKEVGLLDILPDQAAKDAALRYLQTKAEMPEDRVVYAGDSGNDLAAFLSGFKAIVVSNTPEDVKDRVRLRAQRPDRIFVAAYPHAKGVIQGCRHFGVFAG